MEMEAVQRRIKSSREFTNRELLEVIRGLADCLHETNKDLCKLRIEVGKMFEEVQYGPQPGEA